MGREYRILKAVNPMIPYCPKPLVYTEDASIFGCPFYVMERINGIILRRSLPKGLELSPDQTRIFCEGLLDAHYQFHSIDYKGIGLDGFGKSLEPRAS
jgi:aminoglycoside phosphotransferase (APT) family kinase protein